MSDPSSPLSEQQRRLLADRLFQAAVAQLDAAQKNVDAALGRSAAELAQAYVSVTSVGEAQ